MSEYTPGPWVVTPGRYPGIEGEDVTVVIFGRDGEEAGVRGDTVGERTANANLIAAAPALLTALRKLLAAAESLAWDANRGDCDEAIKMASDAIALAEGRAS